MIELIDIIQRIEGSRIDAVLAYDVITILKRQQAEIKQVRHQMNKSHSIITDFKESVSDLEIILGHYEED